MKDETVAAVMAAYTRRPADPAPDWSDVMRRAATDPAANGAGSPAQRHAVAATRPRRTWLARRPRLRVVLVVALVLAILVVPPAVAFHRQLTDLIAGSPAPESVQQVFDRWNAVRRQPANEREAGAGLMADRFPQVDAVAARGVAELDTPGGKLTLWEAPERGGGVCWLLVFGMPDTDRQSGEGNCDGPDASSTGIGQPEWLESSALPGVLIVLARVYGAVSVELGFDDGTTKPMKVVGRHAVAALPSDSSPTSMSARDANGNVTQTLPLLVPARLPGTRCQGICSGVADTGDHAGSAGTINAITATSITVGLRPDYVEWVKSHSRPEDLPRGLNGTTCRRDAGGPSLSGFRVGESVRMSCSEGALTAIAPLDEWADGEIVAMSPTSISLGWPGSDDEPPQMICARTASSPALGGYEVGDRGRIWCVGSELTRIGPPVSAGSGEGSHEKSFLGAGS